MERYEYFKLFHNIGTADYVLLTKNLKSKTFKKGDFITVAGQTQRELYFVKSGVQMAYFDTDKKTHVLAFAYSPKFCAIAAFNLSELGSGYRRKLSAASAFSASITLGLGP